MPTDYVVAPAPAASAQRSYVSEEAGRYQITADRFLDGIEVEETRDGITRHRITSLEIVRATPEFPAVVCLPAGSKIDPGMRVLLDDEAPKSVKLKPHHAGEAIKRRGAAQHFGKLVKHNAAEAEE